jgi:hypothetical protein
MTRGLLFTGCVAKAFVPLLLLLLLPLLLLLFSELFSGIVAKAPVGAALAAAALIPMAGAGARGAGSVGTAVELAAPPAVGLDLAAPISLILQ